MAHYERPNDGMNAIQRYHAKLDNISIRPLKADGERIRSAADAMGYNSLTRFIMDAINEYIENHNERKET